MENMINYILPSGNLNKQQIEFVSDRAKELELDKEECFSEAEKISKQVGFIINEVLRVRYYDNKGEDITKYFIDENNFVVDLDSFDKRIPSSGYVQAVTNCRLIIFSKKNWDEIADTIVGWEGIVNKIVKKSLIQKIDRRSPLVSEDATTCYLTFIELYPQLINRIPLSYLDSYLGITQSSMSRITKSINQNKRIT